ncbi:hypothetical protein Fcan01_25575 [Folsomia candida]|uniref:Odorant receptor n=1 Tax=Folsomia candida TaxID=158441 RepID=A0A226D394_FOLCA|nr:hypothetical protein Fcan01_25575 [Folsomia candida]
MRFPLKNIILRVLSSLTTFAALERFTMISSSLYAQYVSLDPVTREPHRTTPMSRVLPWLIMSVLVALSDINFAYRLISTLAVTEHLTWMVNVDEMCFMLESMEKIRGASDDFGGGTSTLDLIGILLHAQLVFLVTFPFATCATPILHPSVDPTAPWLEDATFLPHPVKILLRMCLIFLLTWHMCTPIFGFGIKISNVCVILRNSLKSMMDHSQSEISQNFKFFTHRKPFYECLLTYRQLQIVTIVMNVALTWVIPVGILILFICALGTSYLVVKMSEILSVPLTFLAVTIFTTIVTMAHFVLPLMAGLLSGSEEFLRWWKLKGGSKHRKKQVASCALLKFNVGGLGCVDGDTRRIFMAQLLYNTVTLVITL